MVMDHGRAGPPGAQGGGAGGINKVQIIRDGVVYVPPHLSKDQDIAIHAGDVIAVSTPGGGGFGRADERPRRRASATSPSATTAPAERASARFGAAQAVNERGARQRGDRQPLHRRLPRSTRDSGWCEGCLRTIDEIAAWGSLDDARQARGLEAPAGAARARAIDGARDAQAKPR